MLSRVSRSRQICSSLPSTERITKHNSTWVKVKIKDRLGNQFLSHYILPQALNSLTMALRIDSPLDQTVETSAMPGAEKTQVAETTLSRYPKRKREEVKYFESDEENSGDSETELVPVKKVRRCRTILFHPLPWTHKSRRRRPATRGLFQRRRSSLS